MLRRPVTLALTIAFAFALAACGDDDSNGSNGRTAATPAPPTTAPGDTTGTTPETTPTTPPPDLNAAAVKLTKVAGGFESPVAMTFAPDGLAYLTEQRGVIRRIDDGGATSGALLDLTSLVGSASNEQGLLGIAFNNDGSRVYVDYTDKNGDTNVDEFAVNGGAIDAGSRRRVLFVEQPFPNHNGGDLAVDADGMLYISFGDGGAAGDPNGNAQNVGVLLGKILRIDPTPSGDQAYQIPADNPFVGNANARGEIWMTGLRNPWRFSFDRATGDTWIADVGQNEYEEIDFAPAGEAGINWGWDAREGLHDFEGTVPPGVRDPIAELSHSDGNCSITGGYVYRGSAIPNLVGAYVYGDFCIGQLLTLTQQGGTVALQKDLGLNVPQLTTFGQDANGEVYAVSRQGDVYRLDPA